MGVTTVTFFSRDFSLTPFPYTGKVTPSRITVVHTKPVFFVKTRMGKVRRRDRLNPCPVKSEKRRKKRVFTGDYSSAAEARSDANSSLGTSAT